MRPKCGHKSGLWDNFFNQKKLMLKIWKRSWEPFRSYLLNSTANPAHFHSNWTHIISELSGVPREVNKKCPREVTLWQCPREVTHFEKKCPRDVIVHEMSPSLHYTIRKIFFWTGDRLLWFIIFKLPYTVETNLLCTKALPGFDRC